MIKRLAIGVIGLLLLFYLTALGVLYFKQRDFLYEPNGKVWALNETALTNTEAVAIPTPGGAVLNGWFKAPAPGKPVILFYKGNSKSFGEEHIRFERWTADGYGFLAFDYRGFPASPGAITQDNVLVDSITAFDWLVERSPSIVIWGRSLGSGPATYVASQREAEALILETPYRSTLAVAEERYWFMPIAWLMHDQFPLQDWIAKVDEPVFVAHGTADRTIPVQQGQQVFDLAPNRKTLWIAEGAGHSDLWREGLPDRAATFISEVEAGLGQD